jgi:hypothetical protein
VVTPGHLRGLSTEAPVVQAAIVACHDRLGPGGARDLVGSDVSRVTEGVWRVRLAGSGTMPEVVEATVTRTHRPPERLTCRASAASAAYAYEVTDIRVLGLSR